MAPAFTPATLPVQDFAVVSKQLVEKFQADSNKISKTPSDRVLDFVEKALDLKDDHKIFSKDLVKLIKLLPEAQALGNKGKKAKLVSLIKASDKFSIGKKITKPKALIIVRNHTFVGTLSA
jgi:hypothetical protein